MLLSSYSCQSLDRAGGSESTTVQLINYDLFYNNYTHIILSSCLNDKIIIKLVNI